MDFFERGCSNSVGRHRDSCGERKCHGNGNEWITECTNFGEGRVIVTTTVCGERYGERQCLQSVSDDDSSWWSSHMDLVWLPAA